MSNPAAPQGAPATPPAAPPAPTPQPPAAPPAPAATPPANPPVPTPPAGGEPLNLTKERFNEIITTRLDEAKKTWQQQQATAQAERDKALAAVFGWTDPNATPDPAELLKQAQSQATAYQRQAQSAMAEALAAQAGIKPERVGTFAKLVDLTGALKDVDPSNGDAVRTAIKTAVDAKAAEFPEWKGSALPGSSGGDGQGGQTPSFDERIAAATTAGNHALAISLKRQKARGQGG